MKTLLLALCLIVIAALFAATETLAAEYYVVKSRSGILRVVDHQPKGGATIVKGPFKTSEEAEEAIGSSPAKGPDTNVK
jgi:hypothetical protein